jgi:hypothetical protein
MSMAMGGNDMRQPGLALSIKRVNKATWTSILLAGLLLAACAKQASPSPTPSGRGWRCAFAGTGATLAFEGKRLNFTCPQQRDAGVGLLGDPVSGPQGWEIEMGVYAHGDEGFTLQSSQMVTVMEIELSDGMHCPFVGTGASLAFEGKRLNFTCPRAGDKEVGLIGDVVQTDRGWEMERATIAHSDQGFALQSSELVPIAALIVVDQAAQ